MWTWEDVVGLPAVKYFKTLSSEALARGRIQFIESNPGFKTTEYAPPFQTAMRLVLMLFSYKFCNDYFVVKDLKFAAQIYPHKNDSINLLNVHLNYWELYVNGGIAPTKEYDAYRESIIHVCARGRLGRIWPRVLHGAVVLHLAPNLDGSAAEDSFEPCLFNRAIGPEEGALDGFDVVKFKVRLPNGQEVSLSPDHIKRETLKGVGRRKREMIEANWPKIEQLMRQAQGFERRRGLNVASIETWSDWLFRRHLLRESSRDIADDVNSTAGFVEHRIKYLRNALDLQPKKSLGCKHGRPPLYY